MRLHVQTDGMIRDCLSRQLEEAVRIDSLETNGERLGVRSGMKVISLNMKELHYQPRLVRSNLNLS